MCHPVVKIAVAAAITASASAGALAQDAREVLAPKGKLRVGAYLGSPLSMVRDSKTGEIHGLSIDLGKELAKRLDVPFEQVSYQRIADVLAGMKAGDVDFTVSNATPARAVDVNFSQTLISLELGYLVPADSRSRQFQTLTSLAFGSALPKEAPRKAQFRRSCQGLPWCRCRT